MVAPDVKEATREAWSETVTVRLERGVEPSGIVKTASKPKGGINLRNIHKRGIDLSNPPAVDQQPAEAELCSS